MCAHPSNQNTISVFLRDSLSSPAAAASGRGNGQVRAAGCDSRLRVRTGPFLAEHTSSWLCAIGDSLKLLRRTLRTPWHPPVDTTDGASVAPCARPQPHDNHCHRCGALAQDDSRPRQYCAATTPAGDAGNVCIDLREYSVSAMQPAQGACPV